MRMDRDMMCVCEREREREKCMCVEGLRRIRFRWPRQCYTGGEYASTSQTWMTTIPAPPSVAAEVYAGTWVPSSLSDWEMQGMVSIPGLHP